MSERADLAIIGAGPAGLAAAAEAASRGLAVTVLDENAGPGGQVWRGATSAGSRPEPLAAGDRAGTDAHRRAEAAGAIFRFGAVVWDVSDSGTIAWSDGARSHRIEAAAILLATGSMERPVVFQGWTLPGVMGAGALQTLFKSGGLVPRGRFIVAGAGPLPLLLMSQLAASGVKPLAYLDTTPKGAGRRGLPHLPGAVLAAPGLLRRGIGLLGTLRRAGVPVYRKVTALEAMGHERLERVIATVGGNSMGLEADILAVHEGVVPQTALSLLLGVEHRWSDRRRAFEPVVDAHGRVADRQLWIAGDGGGIEGEVSATARGAIAGIDIARSAGRMSDAEAGRAMAPHLAERSRQQAFRRFLDAWYPPPRLPSDLGDATIVCRCERVTAGNIRQAIADGATGPNRVKTFTRCGMGLCQGRMCGLALSELVAQTTGRPMDEVGALRIRPPLKPVPLAELAALEP